MEYKAFTEDEILSEVQTVPNKWRPEDNLELASKAIIEWKDIASAAFTIPVDLRLIEYQNEHPEDIHRLTPRQFEELTADLLAKFGYSVKLGPKGADGGVDVFAEKSGDFGPELVLVQCKRFRIDRKVGEPLVKQLHADVTDRRASRGLMVTTSRFSKPAQRYLDASLYRLSGADIDKVLQWISNLKSGR